MPPTGDTKATLPYVSLRLNCGVAQGGYTGMYLRLVDDTYNRIHIQVLCDLQKEDYHYWEEVIDEYIHRPSQQLLKQFTNSTIFSSEYLK